MEFLSDDPTYVAAGLGLLAAFLLVALRLTQQGKYLIWALSALGLAAVVLVVEWLWVTDNERIESAVYGLAKAVGDSNQEKALSFLTDDVRYVRGSLSTPAAATKALTIDLVSHARFDILRLTDFQAHAGGQSRAGTADFRVVASGTIERGGNNYNFGTTRSSWQLGLKEVSPGVWKVNRITPVEVPHADGILPR